jgi:hypothetical protein
MKLLDHDSTDFFSANNQTNVHHLRPLGCNAVMIFETVSAEHASIDAIFPFAFPYTILW